MKPRSCALFLIVFCLVLPRVRPFSSVEVYERHHSMAPKIEIVHDEKLTLGEGPHWDHEAQALYYVDMIECTVFKYVPSTKKITRVIVGKQGTERLAFVVPVEGAKDQFVIGYGKTISLLTWDGVSTVPTSVETLVEVQPELDIFVNDGKADSRGRVWTGTASKEIGLDGSGERIGEVYSLNADGKSVTKHFDGVGVSNGLAWSTDQETFYHIDSANFAVYAFDYDTEKSELKNRRTVFDFVKNGVKGLPDGMTIDSEGNLWIAAFQGSAVIQVDPKTGFILRRIEFPANETTSVAWGGPNLDELYVTSGSFYLTAEEITPSDGRIFKVTGLGASGLPAVSAKL